MNLEILQSGNGHFVQYPDGFKRNDVRTSACGWFTRSDQTQRIGRETHSSHGQGFLIVRVVSVHSSSTAM